MQDSDETPGKAVARRRKSRENTRAVTHGITSVSPVIPGVEEPRDWEAHLEGILESLKPEGRLEAEFARRIALSLWQLNRVDRHLTAVTVGHIESAGQGPLDLLPIPAGLEDLVASHLDQPGAGGQAGRSEASSSDRHAVAERLIPQKSDLKKIIRYEAHLHRLVDRNLRSLEAMQSQRLGRPVYLHRHL